MSDPKNPEDKDIVAKADDEPQVLSDEQLEDADGGFSFSFTPKQTISVDASFNSDQIVGNTADAGQISDKLELGDSKFLRTRPGRIGPIFSGG